MRRTILLALAALVPVLALAGFAAANERSEATLLQTATTRFHDLAVAQDEGYVVHVAELSGATCIANGDDGAMGDHYVNPTLLLDGQIDALAPEALVYETRPNGTMKLVALEYLVFKAAWDAEHAARPSLFGREFDLTSSPNRYGLPAFYSLHAWIWKGNPSGFLSPWNPTVSCG